MNQYLGGGSIETMIWTPTKRLIKQKTYIGVHTEITQIVWKPNKYV